MLLVIISWFMIFRQSVEYVWVGVSKWIFARRMMMLSFR
jgi:hypothetical protein